MRLLIKYLAFPTRSEWLHSPKMFVKLHRAHLYEPKAGILHEWIPASGWTQQEWVWWETQESRADKHQLHLKRLSPPARTLCVSEGQDNRLGSSVRYWQLLLFGTSQNTSSLPSHSLSSCQFLTRIPRWISRTLSNLCWGVVFNFFQVQAQSG